MKGYILHNDEMGWLVECPVFTNKEEAEKEMYGKCRHSIIELDDIADCEPCHPVEKYPMCASCCRFAGVRAR